MVQIYPDTPEPSDQGRIDGTAIYKKGQLIPFYVDGERRGDVRIENVKEHHCNSAAALVAPTFTQGSGRIQGIATDQGGIRSRQAGRRDGTSSERVLAIRLARQELRRAGVPDSVLGSIRELGLSVMEVDDFKGKAFAGSYYVQTKTERHDIFFFARRNGETLSLDYSRYHRTTDLEDFKDHESVSVVDHLDLNGDGLDEVILGVGGYESERYEILSRERGKWEVVAVSHEAGC